jgi:hypothetical protein
MTLPDQMYDREWVFTEKAVPSFQEQPHVFRAPSPIGH